MIELLKQCVGIDISKATFSACICRLNMKQDIHFSESKNFENTKKGFNQLVRWVNKLTDKRTKTVYLMEATGVYYESLAYHLNKIKKTVHVVLPNKSKHYLSSLNIKTKTDAIDAKGLAQFGVERKFTTWQPPRPIYKKLKEITRHRTGLQETKTMFLNRLSAIKSSEQADKFVEKSLESIVKKIVVQIKKCEEQMLSLIQSDSILNEKVDKVSSIKGVGALSATIIIAETSGFEHFHSIKQLISFAGLDVVERQSGSSVNGKTRISKKGNSHIRRGLYFPAILATRFNPKFTQIYARHLQNGKKKMVALVAIQRRLLALMYTLWKKDEHFIENYEILKNEVAPELAEATLDSEN